MNTKPRSKPTVKCVHCNRDISICNIKLHESVCLVNTQKLKCKVPSVNKGNHIGHTAWNKGLTKDTDSRVRQFGVTLSDRYQTGGLAATWYGKHLSEDTKKKISNSRIEWLKKNPDKVPYLLNHSSKMSYPEQYFIEVFENEQIPLLYHKQVGIYQLDFYNMDVMKYIEIDGENHYVDKKTVEIDKRRTVFLDSLGWRGMRIRWSDYNKCTHEQKQSIISDIKAFLI